MSQGQLGMPDQAGESQLRYTLRLALDSTGIREDAVGQVLLKGSDSPTKIDFGRVT